MVHCKLDRARLQHLGAERSELQHFLVGDLLDAPGLWRDARVGGVDAIDVGIDVAERGLEGGGDGNGGSVRPAAA